MNKPKITILSSLFHCEKYLESFLNYAEKLEGKERIEMLLLHNAPTEDELSIIERRLPALPFAKHIIIPEREGLYSTWNRGIRMAQGEYIANWNVDDIRLPDSILNQAYILDNNPEIALAYGDTHYMYEYPIYTTKTYVFKDYKSDPDIFESEFNISCFPMWRKQIHEAIGYFDEQYRLVADFDFQIRVARSFKLGKTSQALGYYLEAVPGKLSSNRCLQDVERHSLYLRYGEYQHFNWCMYPLIRKQIKLRYFQYGTEQIPISQLFRDYEEYYKRKPFTVLSSVWSQPRNILAYIKHHLLKL